MNKLLNYIIPAEDKLKHFYIGSIIFFITACLTSIFWSVIILFIFAAGKEIYDYISKKGKFEVLDFVFNILVNSNKSYSKGGSLK